MTRCEIVAELGNAHNGDRDRLGRLIDAAQAAGADAVKFQCYTPDELVALRGDGAAPEPWGSQGYSMRSLYEKAQTPLEWFPKIAAHCARIGMPWFSSVFGAESLACLEAVGCPRYKISHFECENFALVQLVEATRKPFLVSTPVDKYGCQIGYAGGDGYHIYCPGGYPARLEEMRLKELEYDDGRAPWIGLSSHCLAPEVAPMAIAFGAKYLEYHMMLHAEPSVLEASVSLDEFQFHDMVQSVRRAEELLG